MQRLVIFVVIYSAMIAVVWTKIYPNPLHSYFSAQTRNTLERPGTCHPENHDYANDAIYPNKVIQCAKSKKCILVDQLFDGNPDCCFDEGPCGDYSDENRNGTVPGGNCVDHPGWPLGYTFQCAETGLCLSRLTQPDGVCDCCGPDHDCNTCDDHSDEDACREGDFVRREVRNGAVVFEQKFSCAGKCHQLDKLDDDTLDCLDGIEPKFRSERAADLAGTLKAWCEKLDKKNAPHYDCTVTVNGVGILQCLIDSQVRDGWPNCSNADDEDEGLHPSCSPADLDEYCLPTATHCIWVNNERVSCRCPHNHKGNCQKKQPRV